jgi:hypothetical protein
VSTGLTRTIALFLALALLLTGFSTLTYAQSDDPNGKDGATEVAQPDSPNAVALPNSSTTTTAATAWAITNNGTGRAGFYTLNNTSTSNPALEARSNSAAASSVGLLGRLAATAGGANASAVLGINQSTNANGYGVWGQGQRQRRLWFQPGQ